MASEMTTEEKLEAFVPGVRVERIEDGGLGSVFTHPVVGATGEVCFGVRLDSGHVRIGKASTYRLAGDRPMP